MIMGLILGLIGGILIGIIAMGGYSVTAYKKGFRDATELYK